MNYFARGFNDTRTSGFAFDTYVIVCSGKRYHISLTILIKSIEMSTGAKYLTEYSSMTNVNRIILCVICCIFSIYNSTKYICVPYNIKTYRNFLRVVNLKSDVIMLFLNLSITLFSILRIFPDIYKVLLT